MENELFNLLCKYLENSKHENSIELNIQELFNIILKYKKNKYLNSVNIVLNSPSYQNVATFFPKNRAIEFYVNSFFTMIQYNSKVMELNKEQHIAFLYSELFAVSLHEIEHTNQYAKVKSLMDNSFEKKLLKYTEAGNSMVFFKLLMEEIIQSKKIFLSIDSIKKRLSKNYAQWMKIYNQLYDCILSERLANIYSYSIVKQILSKNEELELIYYIISLKLMYTYFDEYKLFKQSNEKIVLSPTIKLLETMVNSGYYKKVPFNWYSNDNQECLKNVLSLFDFETRYKYGLPITLEEYYESKNELEKVKGKLQKKYNLYYR